MQFTAIRSEGPFWRELFASRLLRFACVSAVNVVLGQTLLYVFYNPVGLPAILANVLSVILSMIPAYLMSRFWVWSGSSTESEDSRLFRADAVPFVALNALGLGLSTLMVGVVTSMSANHLAANVASLGSFGLIWVLKFFVLDRMVWPAGPEVPLDAIQPALESAHASSGVI